MAEIDTKNIPVLDDVIEEFDDEDKIIIKETVEKPEINDENSLELFTGLTEEETDDNPDFDFSAPSFTTPPEDTETERPEPAELTAPDNGDPGDFSGDFPEYLPGDVSDDAPAEIRSEKIASALIGDEPDTNIQSITDDIVDQLMPELEQRIRQQVHQILKTRLIDKQQS